MSNIPETSAMNGTKTNKMVVISQWEIVRRGKIRKKAMSPIDGMDWKTLIARWK